MAYDTDIPAANTVEEIPYHIIPGETGSFRRDVFLERAIVGERVRLAMGLPCRDATEHAPISDNVELADKPETYYTPPLINVIKFACNGCHEKRVWVSDGCQGCLAHPCVEVCPKDAIRFRKNGQAKIDHDACISCGKCHQSCPYHAIVFIPVPCEEACPVKAISKDENGIEHIDESKCIYCGKCLNACPFGAIFEISQAFDVLEGIRSGEKMIAIPAPSILGQFNTSIEAVYGALRQMGFADVVEVAQGAMDTVSHEAAELKEKLEEGQPFMTTSCCPSYIELVNKHIPGMKPYVSSTGSPMYYAARIAKERHPDAKIVFIGPCVAKRKEARRDECVDYILTFEEMASIFEGLDIQFEQTQPFSVLYTSVREAHGFAQAGGVMGAIKAYLGEEAKKFSAIQVSDLNKKNIGLLRAAAKTGKAQGQFIEVMACEGGCISGPSAHNDAIGGRRQLNQELIKRRESYEETHR